MSQAALRESVDQEASGPGLSPWTGPHQGQEGGGEGGLRRLLWLGERGQGEDREMG